VNRILFVAAAACASHAKQSVALYEAGDYAGAARAADEALARYPGDDGLWAMRVRSALALGDTDGVARTYAAYVSHRGSDDDELLHDVAVATLAQALASPSGRLKIAAINAVAELRIDALIEGVAERLADDDDRVAATASAAIFRDHPQAPQVASDMLRSENAEARRIALDGIGRRKEVAKLAVADIEKAGDDPDPRVRRAALHWLGEIRDVDAVALGTRRLRDPDESVRAAAATALARIGLGNLAELATQALGDRARAVRLAGIELLAAAHRKDLIGKIVQDRDPIVGVTAAIALGDGIAPLRHGGDLFGIPLALLVPDAVQRAVQSDDPATRTAIAELIVPALGREASTALARILAKDKEIQVRVAGARLLAKTDRGAAINVLAEAVTELDVDAAAERGTQALSKWVQDRARSPEQRAQVADAHRVAKRITPGLVAALADGNGIVRVSAAATIGALAH
jgi:HEAT repeat protein